MLLHGEGVAYIVSYLSFSVRVCNGAILEWGWGVGWVAVPFTDKYECGCCQ